MTTRTKISMTTRKKTRTIIARAIITMLRIHRNINNRLFCILQNKSFFSKEALFFTIISFICVLCQYPEKIC